MSDYWWQQRVDAEKFRQADIAARRDAILAETQADWDEGKVYEATGVTPEARAELRADSLAEWECEGCGWSCAPNPYLALEDAECDNCGDPLTAASSA